MENLWKVAVAGIIFWSLVLALCIGAIGHLFGAPFWPVAGVVVLCGLCLGGGALLASS